MVIDKKASIVQRFSKQPVRSEDSIVVQVLEMVTGKMIREFTIAKGRFSLFSKSLMYGVQFYSGADKLPGIDQNTFMVRIISGVYFHKGNDKLQLMHRNAFTIWDISSGKPDSQWVVGNITRLRKRIRISDSFDLVDGWDTDGKKKYVYLLDTRNETVLRCFEPIELGIPLTINGAYYYACKLINCVEIWDIARESCVGRLFSDSMIDSCWFRNDAVPNCDPPGMALMLENPLPGEKISDSSTAAQSVPITTRDRKQVIRVFKDEEDR